MRQISLRQRAIEALSRREFSRLELQRRLARHTEDVDALEQLLDSLERENLLSNERFAESLAHRRADKYGLCRLEAEFHQHGLDSLATKAQLDQLKVTEYDRCKAVWLKKFGVPASSMEERARQTRFLSGRGFDAVIVAAVLKRSSERDGGEEPPVVG